ncbi:hypothetical protein [Cryobacterium sp. Y82]|uniref:hypothetical protein n=1 Tax=Cryobacterium sp. Y82 TaxID=2045017 RepID=UPI0011B06166|nr:hypothetical protein [Cryobacterium sp. Y82]
MSYSDILASTALVVSLLTAGWTALRAWRWDRPRVSISGEQWIGERSTVPGRRIAGFSLEVVNTGNQSTQMIAAYWQIDRGNGVDIRFTASHGGGGVDSLFDAPDHANAPNLPFTLDRYGRCAWDFEISLDGVQNQALITRARPVVQFTSRKKTEFAYGAWQPSQIAMDARRLCRES